jgi:twinkle protein
MDVKRGNTPEDLGFDIPEHKREANRDFKVGCPECGHDAKKTRTDVSLKFTGANSGTGHCWSCGTRFVWGSKGKKSSKHEGAQGVKKTEVKKVSGRGISDLSNKDVDATRFFKSRGISSAVVKACQIKKKIMRVDGEKQTLIAFPYYYNGELVNAKHRSAKEKIFAQETGGSPILWNHDLCVGASTLVITEGEMDAMACMEALGPDNACFKQGDGKSGKWGILSVNGGAINEQDKNINGKLQGFTNSMELFNNCKTVIIAVDDDAPGHRLRDEIAPRLPEHVEIRIADFGGIKDANQVLIDKSADDLINYLADTKIWTDDILQELAEFKGDFKDMYDNGQRKGTTTYFDAIDQIWRWRKKEVNDVTGYANEGKSTVFLQMALAKAVFDGDVFAVYTPENMPQVEFMDDLVQCLVGTPMDKDFHERAPWEYFERAYDFVAEHFILINPKDGVANTDSIISAAKSAKRSHGIDHLIIDPYNMVVHDYRDGEREDLYISRFMTALKLAAIKLNISVTLVAHQVTPEYPDKSTENYRRPLMYKIKGGGTFPDKADNVLSFWRPFFISQNPELLSKAQPKFFNLFRIDCENMTKDDARSLQRFATLSSDKIKKQKLVAQRGTAFLLFNTTTGRYSALNPEEINYDSMTPLSGAQNPFENCEFSFKKTSRVEPTMDRSPDVFERAEAAKIEEVSDEELDEECPF